MSSYRAQKYVIYGVTRSRDKMKSNDYTVKWLGSDKNESKTQN